MLEKKDTVNNQHISQLNIYEQNALSGYPYGEGCSKEIVPLIKSFFEKLRNTKIRSNSDTAYNIENIGKIIKHLAYNTHKVERITGNDMINIQKIFDEIDTLYIETVQSQYKSAKMKKELTNKIICLSEIIEKNQVDNHNSNRAENNIHDGKIFQNYESLWLVLHKINTEWSELCERGFSLEVFYDYWETFKYDRYFGKEKSESEKLSLFMGILDGTMKFQPQYEYKAVSYQIVASDFDATLVSNIETKYSNGYQLNSK